jgi:hypothetical protein
MNYVNVPKDKLANICLRFGPLLDPFLKDTDDGTGEPIVGHKLLWALAGRESGFGSNCKPRYEAAYDYEGKYGVERHQAALLTQHGSDAAYSYGPWQVMLCNAIGFSPKEMAMEPEKACVATIGNIRRYVLEAKKAKTLKDIADVYNSGNARDRISPEVNAYITAVRHFYLTEVIA